MKTASVESKNGIGVQSAGGKYDRRSVIAQTTMIGTTHAFVGDSFFQNENVMVTLQNVTLVLNNAHPEPGNCALKFQGTGADVVQRWSGTLKIKMERNGNPADSSFWSMGNLAPDPTHSQAVVVETPGEGYWTVIQVPAGV